MRNRPLIIALIVMGVLALGLTAMTMLNSGNSNPSPDPTLVVATPTPTPVSTRQVVAMRDIPPRTLITRAMVREEETETPAPTAFSSMNDVIGKLSNADSIQAGQPLEFGSVITPLQRVIPANFEVPAGLRAVAVYVDPNSTAAGLVDIGDRVDVISTYKQSFDKQSTERYEQVYVGSKSFTTGRTVAQDLLVLAVDPSIQKPPPVPTPSLAPGATPAVPPVAGAAATPVPTPVPTKVRVVLATTPAGAARLVAAQDSGTLHLTIRNPNSREQQAVTEQREAPSRTVNVPKRQANTGGGNQGGGNNFPMIPPPAANAGGRGLTPADVPTLNPVPPMPGAGTLSPLPSGSDVTVIRGTDKSRVTVPTG